MNQSDHDLPEEFGGIVEQLRAHRAELSPLDLDRIKRDSRARAVGKPRLRIKREERIVMKTRASILAVLASGIVLSGGGVAMGISGLAGSNSASEAQYLVPVETPQPGAPITAPGAPGAPGTVPGVTGQVPTQVLGAHAVTGRAGAGKAGVRGARATHASPAAVAQPTRQQALRRGGSLPFTGYAAIPVLLLGLGLLGTGVMMRRRTRLGDES